MLRNALRSACAVALLACFIEGAASAQTVDKRTVFTFSGPVALPGVTLPAGSVPLPTCRSDWRPEGCGRAERGW
jgi:hypothetical protein